MTVPAPRVRRRPSVPGRVLPLLLVAALLAPVGLLLAQTHRLTGDDRDLATRERLGVQYLRALGPVTDALVDAQAAAVAGRPVSRDTLTTAVEQAAAVDSAIGDELRSRKRWSGLRAKLEALPDRGLTDPAGAFAAYGEVTDLLLALNRKIRDSSGLIRDPQSDSFFLQDGIGGDLPEAMVAAGRLADLTALAAQRPAAERPKTLAELAALRVAALGPATDLVADLRAAVANSESTDLGPNVLTPLDTYQRSVEALAALSAPAGTAGTGPTDPAQVAAARLNAQSAAKQLQPIILDQLDALLRERIDRLDRDRLLAVVAAALAVLLVVVVAVVLVGESRRTRRRAPDERPAREDSGALPAAWQPPAEARQLQPVGSARPGEPERWEPFDAAR
ncbi:hypothetical protein [Micromonospora inositola]|uniref:Nitrate and nitrite sensing n=1 Tax=Micromonospora inositola TaxID=47865 RepID=A0A1C5I5P8_9ACTN|nr:hypothetical protein [Micromonospora inositola]SCG53630.1 hypothetical protein GA0070613_2302 [Micromonospora inositola]